MRFADTQNALYHNKVKRVALYMDEVKKGKGNEGRKEN